MSEFQFEKWYMDVVTEDGNAAIGYYAELTWKKFILHYSGYILKKPGGEISIKNSFKKGMKPTWSGNHLSWSSNGFVGAWEKIDQPIQSMLLEDGSGFVDWNCFMPKCAGKVVAEKIGLEGFGYAEKMTLNVLPWKLPIKELFWGRFLSFNYSIVWIEWRGTLPKILVYFNGSPFTEGRITDGSVQTKDWSISFDSKFELRSGKIGDTVFKEIMKLLSVFPSSIFRMDENKWCGQGTLSLSNGEKHTGTYIHEHVTWQ